MDFSRGFSYGASKLSKAAAEQYSSSGSDSDGDDETEYLMPGAGPNANEFANHNPRKRRRTGRDAKESAALGIFGSESEDDGPGRRWKRRTLRNKGMSFVSSSANAEAPAEDDEDEEDDSASPERPAFGQQTPGNRDEDDEGEEDEEEDATPGIGLGFRSAASQASRASPPTQRQLFVRPEPPGQAAETTYGAQNPLGRGFVPSSAYDPVLQMDDVEAEAPKVARPSAFSKFGKNGKGKAGINPNSFGARMMAKMGYKQGEGLGKEGTGRNVIIEAHLRPQGYGLGAVKEKSEKERQEEKRQAKLRGEVVVDSDEEEKRQKAARRKKQLASGFGSGYASSGASTPKPQRPKFMTMEEVKKAAPGLNIPDAFTPIIDLTGPGKKLLTTSSGLMTPTAGTPGESVEQVESRKLARRAQNDFMAILEEWQNLQNRKAFVDLQMQQERQELEELDNSLNEHQRMTAAFHALAVVDSTEGWPQRWDRAVVQLKSVADKTADDSSSATQSELGAIAVAALHPIFKLALQEWEPLKSPNTALVSGLTSISPILELKPAAKSHRKSSATPYETMMYKLWLPHVSRSIRYWNVRDTDQLLATVEAWKPLVPDFVMNQLLEQDVVRKLEEALAKWEPKRRKQSSLPHLWLFPWLQHLSSYHLDPKSSSGLVAEVKRKFRQLLEVWDYYRGVIPGLKQWKDVLRPTRDNDQWRPLVMSHLLPSMARYVKAQFQVDPSDQEPYMEVIVGEFQWLELVSPTLIGEVLVAEVFPMWHTALHKMLVAEDANLDEVAQWLRWWTEDVFPDELKNLPALAAEFEAGISMVNEALDLGSRAKTDLPVPTRGPALPSTKSHDRNGKSGHHHHHHRHRDHRGAEDAARAHAPAPKPDTEQMSIRQFVEDWCENNDLQFIPERKKVHAEGPLYRITARGDGRGGVLVYFKGIRLYVETKKEPVEVRVDRDEDWVRLLGMAH